MKILALIFVVWMAAPLRAQGAKPASLAELARYAGADREQLLYAGAKKEGKVVWYTSLTSYKEIARVFEARYPGVKVEAYRGNSTEIITRVTQEAQARRSQVDTIETTPPALMLFRDEKLLMPFTTPNIGAYPDDSKEEAHTKLFYWVSDRESFIGLGYNTRALSAAEAPKSFQDLLHPALRGKMAIAGTDTGERMIGAMLRVKGEEFLRKLKEQTIKIHMISGGALMELVASGEVVVSPTIFRNHVLQAQEKGSPVAWLPLDVVPTNAGGVAVSAQAPRPHAALLLLDFLLGAEGQRILEEKFKFGSALKNYGFKRWYPEKGLTTAQYEKANERWNKLMHEVGRK